ncbi:hypothetical protein NU10_00185 [Flavobacterium dauae]|uniref:hypothetical protein n=1 Tax=Flavobacterium dauae TaxID=1563479 RepID=UPI00101B3DF5|nr:hypothetical protein [Flavobacterium dauae]WLD23852.1 hypothetical protein NU10_00185 [Flavobacterium dauae]
MKKYLLLSIITLGFLFSCGSSDDSKKEEVQTPQGKWVPQQIQLIKIVPVYTVAYPHTAGCTKDFLQLSTDNTAKFFHYEGSSCEETEYENAFQRSGNNVSLNIMSYQISGTITTETETNMVIESDISEYVPIIKAMFPEYEQYLSALEGGTVKLSLNKK